MKAIKTPGIALALLLLLASDAQAQTVMVTNGADSGPGTLRQTISAAVSGSTVLFNNALSGTTIRLTSGQIVLSNNVTIDASALADGIQINGNGTSRVFLVNSNVNAELDSLTITNGNGDGYGGGIYNQGQLTMNRITLAGNWTTNVDFAAGGAIQNDPAAVLTLNWCTLYGNWADEGGAIENNSGGVMTLNQCTLYGNSASDYGGAIENFRGTLTLIQCTMVQNHATGTTPYFTGGGGIDNYGATITMSGCILAGNTDSEGAAPDLWDESGPVSARYSLVGNGTNSYIIDGENNNHVGSDASPINPLLAPLGNYGGPTQTMPPLPGSPAIDTGNNDDASSFTTDQRGYPRIAGTAVDIGAVEGVYIATGPGKLSGATRLNDGTVQLTFTNYTDASFPVLATTNLTLPVSIWTQIGFTTENPEGSGQLQFTDTQATNYPQRFYRLRSP